MTETRNPETEARNEAELLRSLGRLARGLSALFWGLPAALVICAETARAEWLKPLGMVPALAGTGLLLYGLWEMSDFQKQERPWLNALDRAKLLGLVNFGLCPFLYWQNKMPGQPFFNAAVFVLVLSALLFLFNVNVVLKQLGAMLPDETLRHETLLVHHPRPLAARGPCCFSAWATLFSCTPRDCSWRSATPPTGWIASVFGR